MSLTDKEQQNKKTKKRLGVIIHAEHCKGCGRCVVACPNGVLRMSGTTNTHGYTVAEVDGVERCTRCGLCFYACPEPDGISVIRNVDET